MSRFPFILLAGVALSVLATSCTGDDEAVPQQAAPELDLDGLDVDDLEVDDVVVMQPGGFATIDPGMIDADEVLSSQHVLRASSPNGPIDLFALLLRTKDFRDDPRESAVPQRCTALTVDESMTTSCIPLDQAVVPFDSLVSGSSNYGEMSVIELLGPEETTHFVVVVDERRYGVTAVAGQAVLPLLREGRACPGSPSLVEAWAGDTILHTDVAGGC